MLLTHASLFTPVDLQAPHLHQGAPRHDRCDGRVLVGAAGDGDRRRRRRAPAALRDAAFDGVPVAQLVRRRGGALVARQRAGARPCSASTPADLGRPLQDLELSYRPVELRRCIDQAYAERRAIAVARRRVAGGRRRGAAARRPRHPAVRRATASCSASSISFIDVTRTQRLQDELERSQAGARDGLRGAAVDDRGARDDQRGAPVDQRGARDDQRGAPVDQRRARDDERGAPVDQRGARRR